MKHFKIEGIQGDVTIIKIGSLPATVKRRESKVVVYGEATGHKHQMIDGELYEDGDRLYLQTFSDTHIIHEEHDEIGIPQGIYEIGRQRQYKSDNMTELVVD